MKTKEYIPLLFRIDKTHLAAKGYGETKPVASNTNEEGRAKNRRVELDSWQNQTGVQQSKVFIPPFRLNEIF